MNYDQNTSYIDLADSLDFHVVVEFVASILRNDGVVLVPTDTVYGLICIPQSARAINDIYRMKQRPTNWRLPIIVANQNQAQNELPLAWNTAANSLAQEFWPGALTIACGIRENNIAWLAGRSEAGIRAPDSPLIQALAEKLGPLLMTSANRHGDETPHSLEGALTSLAFQPTLAINGGILSGAPSTLVNVNLPKPVIERIGTIPKNEIERVLYNDR